MNKRIAKVAEKHMPVYGDYSRDGNPLVLPFRWAFNFLKVFFYKAGFVICVEGLSKSGVAVAVWPLLNLALVWSMVEFLKAEKAEVLEHYPMGMVIFIQAMILFWWFNKSTAKKFILDFVGPALKDLASAFKR